MHWFVKIPFLRILLPFITGILLQFELNLSPLHWFWLVTLMVIIVVFSLLKKHTFLISTINLLFCDLFLFLLAIQFTWHSSIINSPHYYANIIKPAVPNTFVATLTEIPVKKKNSIKCELVLKAVSKEGKLIPVEGNLIAYIKNCQLANELHAGESIVFKARLNEVEPPYNPYQFDYKTYLAARNIHHTAFIDTALIKKLKNKELMNVFVSLGLKVKTQLIFNLTNGGLTGEAISVASALITGFDAEVDETIIDAFSHSGTLHVLSVSGLHVGLIYLVLNFIFGLVDKNNKFKIIRFLFVSLTLWFFVLITGFSAPVLRAVIVFNLLGIGQLFFRHTAKNQLNLLLVSAFLLLIYNPGYIRDLGFLLSYSALAGILCLQPIFSKIISPKSKLASITWRSITASFAATAGTLPITLLYFKQFPLWFAFTNLLVVPLSFAILVLAFLVALKASVFSTVLNYSVSLLIGFIKLFNTPFSYIDGIDFNLTDSFFCTLLVLMLPWALMMRSYKAIAGVLLITVVWQINSLIGSYESKSCKLFSVYHTRKVQTFAFKNKTKVYLNTRDTATINFSVLPHFTSFNNPLIVEKPYNYFEHGAKKVLVLNKPGYWPNLALDKITNLVIGNNFVLTANEMAAFKSLQTVIADNTNYNTTLAKTEELCRKFGVEFYNVKSQGAYVSQLR